MVIFNGMVVTQREAREIKRGTALYDQRTAEQLQREGEQEARKQSNPIRELYQAFEVEDLDTLRFLHEEIATMRKLREAFPDDNYIRQMCRFFIDVHLAEINETMEAIAYDRAMQQRY